MKEGDLPQPEKLPIEFGQSLRKRKRQELLFPDGDDLPLISGTPQQAIDQLFVPEDKTFKQSMLPGMPRIDYDHIRNKDLELRQRRRRSPLPQEADIFTQPDEISESNHVREALAPYIDFRELRRIAASATLSLHEALLSGTAPPEVLSLLDVLSVMLCPIEREPVTSPQELAGLLMVEMGSLSQEQFRVVCLNTKNRLLGIHTVYQGTLNSSPIRPAEVFREPLRLNSAAIITAHNHPSGDPTPSTEDIQVTQLLVEAGKLLQVDVLDHVVIAKGKWVSLRERGLGFSSP